MNNQLALNQESLYEVILTIESLEEGSILEAKEIFEAYKAKQIILNNKFSDHLWQFCDEYSNVEMVFKIPIFMYKKYYQNIFGMDENKFEDYLKTYIMLTMGKKVLFTLREIINDVKRLIAKDSATYKESNIKITRPNLVIEFFNMLPARDSDKKEELLSILDDIAENSIIDTSSRRNLATFQSYFKFNDLLNTYWNYVIPEEERLFFYPLYLWWQITAIIPLRPREFILTSRNCLSKFEEKYFLTLRRNNLKGSSGKVQYKISKDYIDVKYEIPEKLFQSISTYISLTNIYEENITKTLFRTEPHYALFNQKKRENSRFYTYVNLTTCLRLFYNVILQDRFHMQVIKTSIENKINYEDNMIDFIYLGDTRHIAMINLIAEGGTPTLAMQLAGHADIDISSHYFSNISNLIECKTYMKYRSLIKGNEDFTFGANFYPQTHENDFVELENGAKCYSPNFIKGDIIDCKNVIGDNGEIGYCYSCTYFRQNNFSYFLEDDNFYKAKIDNDCNYLNSILKQYRKGIGYQEDIKTAIMKLESSTSQYKNYYSKKLQQKRDEKNAKK